MGTFRDRSLQWRTMISTVRLRRWSLRTNSRRSIGAVELRLILEEVMAELSPDHRRVIELHVLDGLPAAETCEHIDGMSPDNVAQIASRFRRRLREVLEEANRRT